MTGSKLKLHQKVQLVGQINSRRASINYYRYDGIPRAFLGMKGTIITVEQFHGTDREDYYEVHFEVPDTFEYYRVTWWAHKQQLRLIK